MTPRPVNAVKPPLQRVCAGEPLALADSEVDLVALVNEAHRVYDALLDPGVAPDEYRLAEVLTELLVHSHGIERRANGDRILNLQSDVLRYLLPFAVELVADAPAAQRGVARLRLTQLCELPRVLAGDLLQPAATVAGDRLGRRGTACLWLPLDEAARVVTGDRAALDRAVAAGEVPVAIDVRTGTEVVMHR